MPGRRALRDLLTEGEKHAARRREFSARISATNIWFSKAFLSELTRGKGIPRRPDGRGKTASPGTFLAALVGLLPPSAPGDGPHKQAVTVAAEHSPDANDAIRIEQGATVKTAM